MYYTEQHTLLLLLHMHLELLHITIYDFSVPVVLYVYKYCTHLEEPAGTFILEALLSFT